MTLAARRNRECGRKNPIETQEQFENDVDDAGGVLEVTEVEDGKDGRFGEWR